MRQPTHDHTEWWRSRWAMPLFCLFLAGLMFGAFAIGGDAGTGAACAALMAIFALAIGFGSRSETVQGLAGPGRDERWANIDLRANSFAGLVLVTAVGAAWLWEAAHGRDGEPYVYLAAIGGVSYIIAVAYLRWRG